MIHVFDAETANQVWLSVIDKFENGTAQLQPSRNGATDELLHAALTIRDPRQRWIAAREPPINPAFAIAEVVWILKGRKDAAFLNFWNSQLPKYSGNSLDYHGAYGFRLRHHFGLDQLERAYLALKSMSHSRQIVLQIWDPPSDLPDEQEQAVDPDIPCNITSLLKVRNEKLEWMQIMRSNDLFRGVPYNFVQFTSLQEVLAGWLDVELGTYNHLSDSLHIYTNDLASIQANRIEQIEPNTDSLSLPKQESDRVFTALGDHIDELRAPTISRTAIQRRVLHDRMPLAFHHLLLVLAAEAARRRRWQDAADTFMSDCSNPALTQLWTRWLHRVQGESVKKEASLHYQNTSDGLIG